MLVGGLERLAGLAAGGDTKGNGNGEWQKANGHQIISFVPVFDSTNKIEKQKKRGESEHLLRSSSSIGQFDE